MIYRSLVRALIAPVALVAGAMLAGCNSDDISLANNAKANQPVPAKLVAEMTAKDMELQSPILVRLFKQEAELEVWKQDRSGRFALLKTYPICRWSGDLGPKIREGDRQAPEGFYSITPGQMNPKSAYYLSFNTGFPNAFDKALGRTGSELMVHGDCSSRGCYAMTDEQIAEIYAMGRESFFGGQRAFQFQAYPFRMTPLNMAKHRNNPNMPFWKMIKEGNDHFEVTRLEPKVDFCEKKYVFDAVKAPNTTRDPVFEASAKCPAYVIPDEVADAVHEKQQDDETETAKLIAKGIPVARIGTGIDGGMHKIFAAKLPNGNTGLSEGSDGQGLSLALARAPGTIPPYVNPPRAAASDEPGIAFSSPAGSTATSNTQSDGFFSSLARTVGLGGTADATASAQPAPAKSKVAEAKVVEVKRSEAPKAATTPKAADTKQAAAPAAPKSAAYSPTASSAPAAKDDLVAGAQPIVSSNSFESRFSAIR
ncbi:MAG TPA: murein L,D-transpeptidase family protein [Bradyrhizobium sp.]|nr:murein L,D-transpeptidase family protein [Bradyrhizobium sp.]